MFESTAMKITANKLASTSASLLPGSLILISGIVVWRLWHKQAQLQTKTSELDNELKYLKKKLTEINANTKSTNQEGSEQITPLSSYIKKIDRFNPWSTSK